MNKKHKMAMATLKILNTKMREGVLEGGIAKDPKAKKY
jgi:hypothetical protein